MNHPESEARARAHVQSATHAGNLHASVPTIGRLGSVAPDSESGGIAAPCARQGVSRACASLSGRIQGFTAAAARAAG
jgi:hypothetical protein